MELNSSRSSQSSRLSTDYLNKVIDRLKNKKHRLSMRHNYYKIWCQFNQFLIRLDNRPESWEQRLTLFVGFLEEHKCQSTTIRSYVSVIKSVLADDVIEINENKLIINALTRACRLVSNRVQVRLPIQKGLLEVLL